MSRTSPAALRLLPLAVAVPLTLLACAARELTFPDRHPTAIDPATTGTVHGSISLRGEPPARSELAIGGFPACTAAHATPPLSETVLAQNGKLQNVFVYVAKGLEGKVFSIPHEPVTIDQKGCVFVPHVTGVQMWQPLKLANSDAMLHNVRSSAEGARLFNVALDNAGASRVVQFEREKVMVPLRCDVHGWMIAWVGVVDHPFFAVSAADGGYTIPGLPAGKYTLAAWHESLGESSLEVTVVAGTTVAADFSFEAKATAP